MTVTEHTKGLWINYLCLIAFGLQGRPNMFWKLLIWHIRESMFVFGLTGFQELMITSDNMSYTNFFCNYGLVVIHNPSHPCLRNLYLVFQSIAKNIGWFPLFIEVYATKYKLWSNNLVVLSQDWKIFLVCRVRYLRILLWVLRE